MLINLLWLLAAAADLARTDGAGALSVWAVHGNESLTRRISQYNGCKGGKKQQQARIRLLHDNMA